ncbi:MAG: VanZ family protein [Candidatus Aureabacteria bacterium]|nr:VanZ family protein [Candidatus Auribacterota bacterium]
MGKPYALLATLWALMIFVACSIPAQPQVCTIFSREDWLLHLLAFALLAALLHKSFRHSWDLSRARKATVSSFVLAVTYGAGIELWQGWLVYRQCSLCDFSADLAGVAAALWILGRPNG